MAHDAGYTRLFVDRTDPDNPVGISLGEIRRCLYGPSGGTGVDLSRSPNINKWAKFKPLPIGDMSGYAASEAKEINYGLNVPYYTSILDMVKDVRQGTWTRAVNYDANKVPFQYNGLVAGDWARVLDFDGYRGTSPQPVGQLQVTKTTVPPNDTPGFHATLGAYNSEHIVPSDFGFTLNGVEHRNLVYGFLVCDGTDIRSAYLDDTHNPIAMISSASAMNDYISRAVGSDMKPPFTRDLIHQVPMCIFLSWKSGLGSQLDVDMSSTGLFIPLTFTRNQVSITFEPFFATVLHDSIDTWRTNYPADYYIATVIELYPNATCMGRFALRCYKTGDEKWVDTGGVSNIELSLPKMVTDVGGGEGEIQFPVFVKFWTKQDSIGLGYEVVAESYLTDPNTTIQDIYNGVNSLGETLVPESSAIASITNDCTLYMGSDSSDMHDIAIDISLGTPYLGYDQQTTHIIDPTINV